MYIYMLVKRKTVIAMYDGTLKNFFSVYGKNIPIARYIQYSVPVVFHLSLVPYMCVNELSHIRRMFDAKLLPEPILDQCIWPLE